MSWVDTLAASIVIGLAAYRMWRVFAFDAITDRLRTRGPWWLEYWLTCPWCSTVWWCGAVTFIAAHLTDVTAPFIVWPASAAVAGWVGVVDRRVNMHDDTGG